MKISIQEGKNCEKVLKIEVPQEHISREFDEYYKAIASEAKVPGFRPGKAPRHVLQLHYSSQAREAVLKNLISDSYRTALQEKALSPLGYPDIQDVVFEDDKLSYQAKIETRPKIKLGKVTGLSVKKEKKQVSASEIDKAMERLRESLAQYKAVEDRAAQKNDFVIADYVCTVNGKEIEKRNDDWFEIKEDEFLKGFSTQLIGLKPGEEKQVEITFPEKMSRADLAGKLAVFAVKVKEIKQKTLPELNDELAKEAGEFQTLAELRAKIEKDIQANLDRETEVKYEKALLDELVKNNKVELPDGVVERRLQYLTEDAFNHQHRQHHHHHGQSPEELEAEHKKMHDDLRKELEPEARRQVHVAFLLDEIADREKIEVSEQDVKSKFEEIAAQANQPFEAVAKYYMEKEDSLDVLREQIRNEKTIDYLKRSAKSE